MKGRSGGSCFLLLLFFRDKRKGDIGAWGYPPGVGVVVEGRDGMDDGMVDVVVVGMCGVGCHSLHRAEALCWVMSPYRGDGWVDTHSRRGKPLR